jgi:tripartite-type tricarboxylate transporter receptor subunit TctC
MRFFRLIALFILLAALPAAQAQSDTFPERPIRMLVGWPAGGGTDVVSRLVAARLADSLGKPVVVDNKPGASGQIASMELVKSAPDGYTVLVQIVTSAVIRPLTQKSLPYDAVKDFQPVALIAKLPNVMIINKDIPATNLREFIAWVKAHPGKTTFGSGALGGVTHLAGELFNKMAGTDMVHVPFKGAAPAIQDLLGGRIDMVVDNITGTISLIKAGSVRALGVTSEERASMLPDVPTLAEAGLPRFKNSSWIALFTRSGVPAPVLARLESETLKAIRYPETASKIAELGAVVSPMNAAELDRFWKAEFVYWREALDAAKIKLD